MLFLRSILRGWRRLWMLDINYTWRGAGILTRCQHVGIIWRSLSAVRLQLPLVSFMTSPVVTATSNHGWFPISKIIWTWDIWNFMTYLSSVLLNFQLWVMIWYLLDLLTLFNILHKIIPYSITMTDLDWSRRILLKNTKTIVLTPRLKKWCYFT